MEYSIPMMESGNKNSFSNKFLFVTANPANHIELIQLLIDQGFQTRQVDKFSEAFTLLLSYKPEVIILDASGNEISALEICSVVKSMNSLKGSIVIILSNRKDELMEISSFNAGAEDFVIYPIRANAFLERIKVRLRIPGNTITVIQDFENAMPLKIDRESYSVSLGNHFIRLSRKEFELLYLLASNPEKLFRREEIFNIIWNKKTIGKNRTIDVHISRLRQKVGNRFITSQKGLGYRFKSS